jgi:hypothetical protein
MIAPLLEPVDQLEDAYLIAGSWRVRENVGYKDNCWSCYDGIPFEK